MDSEPVRGQFGYFVRTAASFYFPPVKRSEFGVIEGGWIDATEFTALKNHRAWLINDGRHKTPQLFSSAPILMR